MPTRSRPYCGRLPVDYSLGVDDGGWLAKEGLRGSGEWLTDSIQLRTEITAAPA
jgi:hypothetical protein